MSVFGGSAGYLSMGREMHPREGVHPGRKYGVRWGRPRLREARRWWEFRRGRGSGRTPPATPVSFSWVSLARLASNSRLCIACTSDKVPSGWRVSCRRAAESGDGSVPWSPCSGLGSPDDRAAREPEMQFFQQGRKGLQPKRANGGLSTGPAPPGIRLGPPARWHGDCRNAPRSRREPRSGRHTRTRSIGRESSPPIRPRKDPQWRRHL